MADGSPRRILVRCPNPVGDAVMSTPALRALRTPRSVGASTADRQVGARFRREHEQLADALAHLEVTKPCCRKAEVSAMLRFAGGLHIVGGRIVVEAEVDNGATARRLRKDIAEVYGHPSEVAVVAPGGLRKGSRYVVRPADARQ